MQRNELQQYVRSILLTIGCAFALMGPPDCFGAVQDFSGSFINNENGTVGEIRFTVPEHSEVDFEFNSICKNPLTFFLNGAYNQASVVGGHAIVEQYSSNAAIDKVPLYKGDYIAIIRCSGELDDPPPSPEWTMKITNRVITIPNYQEDKEPPSDTPVNVFSSRSFSGWLDLWGTPATLNPVTYQDNGLDSRDIITVNMKKGTRLKIKVEWEFTTTKPDPVNMKIALYRYKNDGLYYVELPFSSTDNPATSDEITLLEDGVYKLYLTTFSWTDKKRYGGYWVSFIVNDEPVPNVQIEGITSIKTTYRDANWQWYTTDSLVVGEESQVEIWIGNYDTKKTLNATLVYGLSVRGGTIKPVGVTKLNLPGTNDILLPQMYQTTLTTPTDTPISLKGDLVVLLYDATGALLDKRTFVVDMWGPHHGALIVPVLSGLLLGQPLVP